MAGLEPKPGRLPRAFTYRCMRNAISASAGALPTSVIAAVAWSVPFGSTDWFDAIFWYPFIAIILFFVTIPMLLIYFAIMAAAGAAVSAIVRWRARKDPSRRHVLSLYQVNAAWVFPIPALAYAFYNDVRANSMALAYAITICLLGVLTSRSVDRSLVPVERQANATSTEF